MLVSNNSVSEKEGLYFENDSIVTKTILYVRFKRRISRTYTRATKLSYTYKIKKDSLTINNFYNQKNVSFSFKNQKYFENDKLKTAYISKDESYSKKPIYIPVVH